MTTIFKLSLSCALVSLTALGAFIANAAQPERKTIKTTFDTTVPSADPVYDSAGIPAVAPDTLLYSNSAGLCDHLFPLIAPDDHHITLAEWKRPTGHALLQCLNRGSHVVFQLNGLVPNGVYTVWLGIFESPGVTPDFAHMIGLGALGAPDGSENVILASPNGTAALSVFHPTGDLSIFGTVGCLSDEFEVMLFFPLHLDGQTHGGEPGNECELGFQGAFRFRP